MHRCGQRPFEGRRFSCRRWPDRHRDNVSRVQVDRVLFIGAKYVRPSFILVIFASGSFGLNQSSFEPFFFRFRGVHADRLALDQPPRRRARPGPT